ncbi:hypothetical protein HWI79_3513 [Cryptosporidium felis]|nr:hypothetical protein HWI79_3513 [Cryptosporidium felis]
MNKFYEWLSFKTAIKSKTTLMETINRMNKKDDSSHKFEKINNFQKKIQVEIEGEPKVKKICLTPRSTPIVMEIDLTINRDYCNQLKLDPPSMLVEWESTQDEIIPRKKLNTEIMNEKRTENSRHVENCFNFEHELSVAYLGRQNKRIYLHNDTHLNPNIDKSSHDADLVKTRLSERLNSRY